MDPVTALSIAAAAVQFIDFGLKTLALCKRIRDSDADTTALHAELQQSIKQLEDIQKGVTTTALPRVISRAIKGCSQDCSSAAKELQDLLSEIQKIAQKKRFGVARAAFRAMKDQRKIEKIQVKLEKCQARFQTAVSVDTREQVLALLQGQGQMSQTLEDVVYPELKRMHVVTQDQITDFRASSTAAHEATRKALANLDTASKASGKAIQGMKAEVKYGFDHAQTSHTHQLFLESLEYPEMFSRHRHIEQPTSGTFEWIFAKSSTHTDRDPKTKELRGRFSKWLQSSEHVFWVNGKAGSGKSSLMSFIESHERTNDLLKIWAGGRKLHVFSFFFWRAGSEMQKSIPGLLQSLLYQLARAKPSIVSGLMLSDQSAQNSTWTEWRLERAVEQALSLFSDDRIFLLIDGLDEFEGKYTALVALLLRIQDRSAAKLCLSSRPETALIRQLGSYPSLKLQDLNYQDIENFVRSELEICTYVFKDPEEFLTLTSKVARRAEGIFLWAVLVCKSLVSGYEAMDDESMLQQRLAAVPSGLEDLFAHMFSNIEREHRESLARCFFLLKWEKNSRYYRITLPLLTAFLCERQYRSLDDFRKDLDVIAHRVVAQGKGLFELHKPDDMGGYSIFGRYILRDAASGKTCYRSVAKDDPDLMLGNEIASLGLVHRSAYDCILGDSNDRQESWLESVDEVKLLRDLLDAMLWLAYYSPGEHLAIWRTPTRGIANLIEIYGDRIRQEGYQALDELYETIQEAHYGDSCAGFDQGSVIGSKDYQIHKEAGPLRVFWQALALEMLGDYLLSRFDRVKSSVYSDLLYGGLLESFAHRINSSNANLLMPVMILSVDQLINKGPLGHLMVASRGAEDLPGISSTGQFCFSWVGSRGEKERRLISDLSGHVVGGNIRLGSEAARDPFTKHLPGALELATEVIKLSKLWQIHWGQKFCGRGIPYTPLQVHVPVTLQRLGKHERRPVDCRSLLNWRFICFDQSKDYARQYLIGEYLPIVASFELRVQSNQELMLRFGRVGLQEYPGYLGFKGTPDDEAYCLQSIIKEVWEDAKWQFKDGWQQLYLLACLKKHFGAFWMRPKKAKAAE